MTEIESERGSASVEQVGLGALVALLFIFAVSAVVAEGEIAGGRELGAKIGKRLVCGPRVPDACRHHSTVPAYGWPIARLLRAMAPPAVARIGPGGGPLVPVDFRRCRRTSCATPGAPGSRVTASGRRPTLFTAVSDRRPELGWVELAYWGYRPSLGWERLVRRAFEADIDAAASVRVLASDTPALVPLETLPGRDHYVFPAGEEPPWRWQVGGRYPGWSS